MSIARFVTWGGTGILTTETQDFGLIIKYGVSEKVYLSIVSIVGILLVASSSAFSVSDVKTICGGQQYLIIEFT